MTRVTGHPGAQLTAVAGRDHIRAATVATTHGAHLSFGDYRELLASSAVDAVMVVAPDNLREDIAAAVEHGNHVLCVKPPARTAQAARPMADAALRSGLINMSYFNLRTSAHHYLHQLVVDGAIGTIQSAEFTLTHGMFRSGEYNWRFDSAAGDGVIAEHGCYVFDLARWYVEDVTTHTFAGAQLRSSTARTTSPPSRHPPTAPPRAAKPSSSTPSSSSARQPQYSSMAGGCSRSSQPPNSPQCAANGPRSNERTPCEDRERQLLAPAWN
jgi:predicted dehydrogenase